MGGKSEHDEVSVGTVEAVVRVGVVVRGAALPANVVHYLEEDEGGGGRRCRVPNGEWHQGGTRGGGGGGRCRVPNGEWHQGGETEVAEEGGGVGYRRERWSGTRRGKGSGGSSGEVQGEGEL